MSCKALNILLSNDDGYQALGINTLFDGLSSQHQVTLCAPKEDCSGRGQAITLDRPLALHSVAERRYWVDGTPADSVMLAISQLALAPLDLVLTGVNHGANLGDDVLYSGTLGAALEGRHHARLCLAVSLCGHQHFATALAVVERLLAHWPRLLTLPARVLSLNVPDLPLAQIKGIRVCGLGARSKPLPAMEVQNPKGASRFWVGLPGQGQGPDFEAIASGYASLSPITYDRTHQAALEDMRTWQL